MLKNIYIRFLLFWEDAMFSLTESWKDVSLADVYLDAAEELHANRNDVPNGDIQHVDIKGEN